MELWDILDEQGNKTGRTIERGKPLAPDEYHLIVDVWIIGKNGDFLISKRTPDTNPEPDRWQPTCGCAIVGDDSISAALRETREELGITLDPQNGRLFKRFKPWPNSIIDVWVFHQDVDINTVVLQPRETDDVMWASENQIKQLIKKDDFLCHDRLPYMDELFQQYAVKA